MSSRDGVIVGCGVNEHTALATQPKRSASADDFKSFFVNKTNPNRMWGEISAEIIIDYIFFI
jgi:hypothetical protein